MTILFAYDGSESAGAAIAAAGKLFEHDRPEAVVLSVWEPLTVEALRAVQFGGWLPLPLDVNEVDERSEAQAQFSQNTAPASPPRPGSRPVPCGSQTSYGSRTRSSNEQSSSTPT